jgi:hypothetical protein
MSEARASFPPHRAVRRLCVPYRAGLCGSTEQAVPANDRPCRFAVKSGTAISELAGAGRPSLDGLPDLARESVADGQAWPAEGLTDHGISLT